MLLVPPGPQMTRRIGKSLEKLLTNRAVEMAVGLAGAGGGKCEVGTAVATESRPAGGAVVGVVVELGIEEASIIPWPAPALEGPVVPPPSPPPRLFGSS